MGRGVRGTFGVALPLIAAFALACTVERADVRTPSGRPPEADTTVVRQAIAAVANAFETGDLTVLDSIYADNVTIYEGGNAWQGWRRYRDEHLIVEIESLTDRRLQFENIEVRLAGTTAWSTYSFTLTALHGGTPIRADGVATMVFRKLGGGWRIVHSHTSARAGNQATAASE
jgi:ketosteroid isomerase-like protein